MKCILMNKNTGVLAADYDSVLGIFFKIYDIYNIKYAPYILESYYDKNDLEIFRINLSA